MSQLCMLFNPSLSFTNPFTGGSFYEVVDLDIFVYYLFVAYISWQVGQVFTPRLISAVLRWRWLAGTFSAFPASQTCFPAQKGHSFQPFWDSLITELRNPARSLLQPLLPAALVRDRPLHQYQPGPPWCQNRKTSREENDLLRMK